MQQMSRHVTVAPRFSRAVNIERDSTSVSALDGYVLTSTAQRALERICSALSGQDPGRQRAWTLTGSYGSGKSAFALFLGTLLGDVQSEQTMFARSLVRAQHPDLYKEFLDGRRRNGIAQLGYLTIFVSGSTEPIVPKLLDRASRSIEQHRGAVKKARSFAELERLRRVSKNGRDVELSAVVDVLSAISGELSGTGLFSGILIVVDELGKFLEHAARTPDRNEIFLLQQLAEASTAETGLAVITVLHQAFEIYAAGLRASVQNEWAKVQGRFEDIAFQEPPEQMLLLIAAAIRHTDSVEMRAICARARKYAESAWELQLAPGGLGKREFVDCLVRCAPLHPLSALVLARLCKKFGQNQRSLFAFLTSHESNSFTSFLESSAKTGGAEFFRLPNLYDYMTDAFGAGIAAGENATRWAEVQSALDKCARASADEIQVLKAIGLLSATGSFGNLKPSEDVIAYGLGEKPLNSRLAIESLLSKSILVRRRHNDTIALWQGSDVDLEERAREARRHLSETVLSSKAVLNWQPRPFIAKRHSYETGTLRYFDVRFANAAEFSSSLQVPSGADGLLLYCLPENEDERQTFIELAQSSTARDRGEILIAVPIDVERLRDALYDLEVLAWIENNTPELAGDAVGRRELQSRKTIAQLRVANEVEELFSPASTAGRQTAWFHRGIRRTIGSSRRLAAFLSDICDEVYSSTAPLRNELLNRRQLSSAAAAARRNLLERMIACGASEALGMTGNPPEMTMYASVLRSTRIHRKEDSWAYGAPDPASGVLPVWQAVESFFSECELRRRSVTELFGLLQHPPFGLKMGLIPVLFCAAILAHDTEVAVYENDAFVPELTIEIVERLLRNPERFKLRRYNIIGIRRDVFKAFASLLVAPGNASEKQNVVAVVRPLFRFLTRLPEYTRNTRNLSEKAIAVREAMFASREPDQLLFDDLPQACGFPAFTPSCGEEPAVDQFFLQLKGVLGELQRAYDELLSDLEKLIYVGFGLNEMQKARDALRFRAQRVLEHAIDPRLKAFSHHLVDEELEDILWVEAIATLVVGKPPRSWNDNDRAKYEINLTDLIRAFRHLEALVFELSAKHQYGEAPVEVIRIGITDTHSKESEAVVAIAPEDRESLAKAVYDVETSLEQQHLHDFPEVSLAALAIVSRKLLEEITTRKKRLSEVGEREMRTNE